MNPLRRLVFPVPSVLLVLVLIGTFGAAWLASNESTRALVVVWPTVSSTVREGLFVAGPIAGIGALILAIGFNRRASLLVPTSGVRAGRSTVIRHLSAVFGAGLVGYLAGLTPMLFAAAQRATSGGPDVAVMLSAIPVLGAYIGIGYVTGTLLRGWKGMVTGLVALGGFSLIGSTLGSRWWSVTPVWTYGHTRAGFVDNPVLTAFRSLFFGLVIICLAVISSAWVAERGRAAGPRYLRSVALICPLVALILFAGGNPTAIQYRDPNPPRVCTDASGIEICVHEAHATLLDEFASTVASAIAVAGPLADDLESVEDESLLALSTETSMSVLLNLDSPSELRGVAALEAAGWLSRSGLCSQPEADFVQPIEEITSGLRLWIYRHVAPEADQGFFFNEGVQAELAARLDTLSGTEVDRWLGQHVDDLKACSLTVADLP